MRRRRTFLLLLLAACAPPEPEPAPLPVPDTVGPEIRIGVMIDGRRAAIGGPALTVDDPAEGTVRTIAAGAELAVVARGAMVSVTGSGARIERPVLVIRPLDGTGPVVLNGRAYRGDLELRRAGGGLLVVNVVPLERYLAGVVGAELGRRAPEEIEALKAQAVASRTYAIRNQGRWKDLGFDLMSSVGDQVYTGELDENSLAAAAVAATRGQILTWGGQPIDAFFSSTCGGRTEDGTAAFAGASRPYLHSVDDHDEHGVAWCATSPRYHWKAGWTAAELARTLRRTLAAERLPGARATDLRDVRIDSHTATGRVATIELVGRNGRTGLVGQAIRRVMSLPEGGPLWSTDFTLHVARTGTRLERVDIDGRGNGHGVGMCQWGAIGRARAGQDYQAILSSYFPGTEIRHAY